MNLFIRNQTYQFFGTNKLSEFVQECREFLMVIWYLNNRFKIVVFKISNKRNIIHTGFRGFVIIQSRNLPKGNFCIFKVI